MVSIKYRSKSNGRYLKLILLTLAIWIKVVSPKTLNSRSAITHKWWVLVLLCWMENSLFLVALMSIDRLLKHLTPIIYLIFRFRKFLAVNWKELAIWVMISHLEHVQHSDSPKRESCCASGPVSPTAAITVARGKTLQFDFHFFGYMILYYMIL